MDARKKRQSVIGKPLNSITSEEEDEDSEIEVVKSPASRRKSSGIVLQSEGTFYTSSDVSHHVMQGSIYIYIYIYNRIGRYMLRINDPKRIYWDLFVMACATWNVSLTYIYNI